MDAPFVARMLSNLKGGSGFAPGRVTIRSVTAAVLLVVVVAAASSASSVHSTEHATDARLRSVWHDSAPVEESTPRVSGEVIEPGRGSFDKADAASQQPNQQQQQQRQDEEQEQQELLGESDGASPLSFTSSNLYPAVIWSPWKQLAEPCREAILVANSTQGDPEHDLFMWTLPTENGATYEGRWVCVQCVLSCGARGGGRLFCLCVTHQAVQTSCDGRAATYTYRTLTLHASRVLMV